MGLLLLSFIAWLLTILAPCVLPLLPVIVGWSVINGKKSRPRVIIASFAVSVLLFTLSIKWLVDRFGIFPDDLIQRSGWILIVVGLFFLFPIIWQWIMVKTGLEHSTQEAQIAATSRGWVWSDILLGMVLGPVFNSCSPTFAIVIATILPGSFVWWLINILVYIAWLVIVLSFIAYWWRKAVAKMKRAANPRGRLRISIAVLIILVGVALLNKRDKKIETAIYERGWVIDTTQWELGKSMRYRK